MEMTVYDGRKWEYVGPSYGENEALREKLLEIFHLHEDQRVKDRILSIISLFPVTYIMRKRVVND